MVAGGRGLRETVLELLNWPPWIDAPACVGSIAARSRNPASQCQPECSTSGRSQAASDPIEGAMMTPMPREAGGSDTALVEACLRGEADAWEQLVRRYAGLVYSVARRYGLGEEDAADVFQGTWSALWERLTEVRNRARLGPLLITVARPPAHPQPERRPGPAGRPGVETNLG